MSSSSPYRDRSSPSRQLLREDRRASGKQTNSSSPYRNNHDSPSRQLYEEFSRLYVNDEKNFQEKLDARDAEQERKHREALALAAAEHDRVRQSAERARELLELEIERERKRREDEELRALEGERRLKMQREEDARQRAVEQVKQQQAEEQRRAQQEKELQEAQAQLAAQKQKNEAEAARRKTEQEEAQRKTREEAEAIEKHRLENANRKVQTQTTAQLENVYQNPTPTTLQAVTARANGAPAQQTTAPSTTATAKLTTAPAPNAQTIPAVPAAVLGDKAEREVLHQRYLDLHKRLKEMRQYAITECKKLPALKNQLGDWRRQIQKATGQLRAGTDRTGNQGPSREITGVLQAALKFTEPSIDVSSFIISFPHDGSPLLAPAAFIYLLNILSKCAISQFISEASVAAKAADPIGIVLVSVFAQPIFKLKNGTVPLIDILLAKFHVVCPVLWGIYGNEKTPAGRDRIGWWKADGVWVPEQRHNERMSGLAAGYAAIALRDFTKSRNESPFPVRNYWIALSRITSVPAREVQPTHLTVLKALVDGQVQRFLGFYGRAGVAALRAALVDFPAGAPDGPAKSALVLLPELIQRDLRLTLTG